MMRGIPQQKSNDQRRNAGANDKTDLPNIHGYTDPAMPVMFASPSVIKPQLSNSSDGQTG